MRKKETISAENINYFSIASIIDYIANQDTRINNLEKENAALKKDLYALSKICEKYKKKSVETNESKN